MAIPKADFMWVDGKLVRWDDAQLPFLTHTFHYGLGVFEGIRAYKTTSGTAVFRLKEHMKRLYESAHICAMEMPYSVDALCKATVELIQANKQQSCYVRPVAYYGDEAMGLGAVNSVHVGIAAFQWGAYLGDEALKSGIRAKISSFQRRAVNTIPVKGKITGAYVNSILAKREAQMAGYDEAIMLDANGYISEATGENIFMVKDGELITPPLGGAILAGITRDAIIRIARDMKMPVAEREFSRDMLYCADECFLTGTAAEVTPVREVDNRKIGAGTTGPMTRELQATFFRAARGDDARYASWLTPVDH
jgi:branched-chain amino acid aminotransferase